jgi:hypothetical protein
MAAILRGEPWREALPALPGGVSPPIADLWLPLAQVRCVFFGGGGVERVCCKGCVHVCVNGVMLLNL